MATSNESPNDSSIPKEPEKPPIEPLRLPTIEEIRGQDIWNNCAVRSVFSGVMGTAKLFFVHLILFALFCFMGLFCFLTVWLPIYS